MSRARRDNMKKKDPFWEKVKENARKVKKWPKWKQNIEISAEAAATGKFLRKGEE